MFALNKMNNITIIITCFEYLKTVNGTAAATFYEVCKLQNLLAEDRE